ncbi:MAG TPA: hypothetical protein VFB59_00975 [Candidatus Saccharimonadales bacterium]|nr:hypothetical protein [Candidatus Saccharimonadales bacterium]
MKFRALEPNFAVPLFTELLLERRINLKQCMNRNRVLSLATVLDKLGFPDTFELCAKELKKTSEAHKMEHMQTLIDCLANGDESVYGSPDAIVETYRYGKSGEEAQWQARLDKPEPVGVLVLRSLGGWDKLAQKLGLTKQQ